MLRVVLTSIFVYFASQSICAGRIQFLPKRRGMIVYNFLVVFCFYSFLNIFVNNYQINFLFIITIFYLISLAMYYVHEFRGTNINFSDILSLNTAKEVAGGYKYEIRPIFVIIFVLILAEYLLHILVYKIHIVGIVAEKFKTNIGRYVYFWNGIFQLFCFLLSFFLLKDKMSQKQYDYSLNAGENEGYIYNFFSSMPIFHRSRVDSISSEKTASDFIKAVFETAKENIKNKNTKSAHDYVTICNNRFKNYTIKNIESPHILVIMNESFGTAHKRIQTNIEVTPYYDSLSKVTKGNLFVNTFGGGTANTEFEFLTGMTIGNYPYPVMPYNNFVKRDKYSIARYFNNLGYKTVAMHPYTATNYHRDKVYKRFGFDELLFFEEFKNKQYVRNFVSDRSMYEEIIRKFRSIRANGQKLFLFGITMQNHSGYKNFAGAEVLSHMTNYRERESVDAYLSLMKISDEAIELLINYFDSIEDHVIILFFGDHNASFGSEINKIVYEQELSYECSNAYMTPFFIYDNKNRKDEYIDAISANFLSIELLKKANLPFDILHDMLNEQYSEYSVYNYHKAMKRDDNKLYDIPYDKFMRLEKEYLK